MRRLISAAALVLAILCALPATFAQTRPNTLVVVYKDGHRQSLNLNDIERLEFPSAVPAGLINTPGPSRSRFLGKWEVGDGNGDNFYITIREDGSALRTMGMGHEHGSWQYINGEAEVTWDDGWQDCLRKVGNQYKKYAYHEGKTFTDEPDNVTNARNTSQNPSGVD